jgi:UDP-glucose 4-epimerase
MLLSVAHSLDNSQAVRQDTVMKLLVTGGAGFIGSTFCDRALLEGHEVLCFDSLITGNRTFLEEAFNNPRFTFVRGDICAYEEIEEACAAYAPDWVVHFAANADVRRGLEHPRKDLEVNTIGTWNVVEAARKTGVKKFLFSSTGSVYGEPEVFPTPEDAPFPDQTSLYGASKVAGETLISAYCHGYGMTGIVFRFVSILGPRYTHGHVFDFVRQLMAHPEKLDVLGDGNQNKSYLHSADLMDGLWCAIQSVEKGILTAPYTVLNIGHDSSLTVKESIAAITKRMGVTPTLAFAGGVRGWIGDSPRIQLATEKLKGLGWKTTHSLEEGVSDTVDYLLAHPELFEDREKGV